MYTLSRNKWVITSVIGIISSSIFIIVIFFHYNNQNLYRLVSGVDKFGIREIYPTKSGGEEWFMNMQDPTSDPRFDPQATITKNPDGSYKVTNKK
jgi:hypothetical protein